MRRANSIVASLFRFDVDEIVSGCAGIDLAPTRSRLFLAVPGEVVSWMDFGDPDRIRTCDLRIRNPTFYPTELRDHVAGIQPHLHTSALRVIQATCPCSCCTIARHANFTNHSLLSNGSIISMFTMTFHRAINWESDALSCLSYGAVLVDCRAKSPEMTGFDNDCAQAASLLSGVVGVALPLTPGGRL